MKKHLVPPFFALRLVLGIIVFTYCLLGIGALVGGTVAQDLLSFVYGTFLLSTPEIIYLVRVIGVFLLGIGIIGAFAWYAPVKHRPLIGVVALFLVLRGIQKLVMIEVIAQTFSIPVERTLLSACFYLLGAWLLLYLRPRA